MNKVNVIFAGTAFICASCGSPNISNQQPSKAPDSNYYANGLSSQSNAEVSDTLKSNWNGDTLKSILGNLPFNCSFKPESTGVDSEKSYFEGRETIAADLRDTISLNIILVHINSKSRKTTSVVFYLNSIPSTNIKIKDLKKLFEFLNYFDPGALNFMVKNFKTIFYNEKAFDNLEPNANKDKNMSLDINHSLYDGRIAEKKNSNVSLAKLYVDRTIEFH